MSKLIERFDGFLVCESEGFWKPFREVKVEIATEVCGVSQRRKVYKVRNVFLDEDVRNFLSDKRKAWLDWLFTKANERIQKQRMRM